MSQAEINIKRSKLENLYRDFFKMLGERRELVRAINTLKTSTATAFKFYSPDREREVFQTFKLEIQETSLKELLALSLLMESHAQFDSEEHYPSWSRGVHLEKAAKGLIGLINPLLLQIYNDELFNSLDLGENFKKLLLDS